MKIKAGFIVREIAGSHIAMPVGEMAEKVGGMVELTGSGAILWKKLEVGATEEELVATILEQYEIDEETAKRDVSAFLASLAAQGWLED